MEVDLTQSEALRQKSESLRKFSIAAPSLIASASSSSNFADENPIRLVSDGLGEIQSSIQSVPGLYPLDYLQKLAFDTKIETILAGRCLTGTSMANSSKIFIGGAEITKPVTLGFNLVDEMFREVSLSMWVQRDKFRGKRYDVLNDCFRRFNKAGRDVWVMRGYCVQDSWVQYRISDPECMVCSLICHGSPPHRNHVLLPNSSIGYQLICSGHLQGVWSSCNAFLERFIQEKKSCNKNRRGKLSQQFKSRWLLPWFPISYLSTNSTDKWGCQTSHMLCFSQVYKKS